MTTRSRPFTLGRGLALGAALTLAGGAVGAATFASDPGGNNGTVKVSPHNACDLTIVWSGFDKAGVISDVDFAVQSPTDDVQIAGIHGDLRVPLDGAGAGTMTYSLYLDGDPHPVQGYHLKVTVHTPASKGNDTKSKVFWVAPCGDAPPGDGTGDGGGTFVL